MKITVPHVIRVNLILVGMPLLCFAQPRSTDLDDRIDSFKIEDATWFQALSSSETSGWRHNLRMGFIFNRDPWSRASKHVSLQLSDVTVREILDTLLASDTNYYWVSDGNVANFIDRRRVATIDTLGVLNSTMSKCEASDVGTVEAIRQVIEQAKAQGIAVTGGTIIPAHGDWEYEVAPEYRISFSTRNSTLRECLNMLIRVGPSGFWAASPSKAGVWIGGAGETEWNIRKSLSPELKRALSTAKADRPAGEPFISSSTIIKIAEGRHYDPNRIIVHLEYRAQPGIWVFIVERPEPEIGVGPAYFGESKCLFVDARAGIVLEENGLYSSNHNGPRCWKTRPTPRTVASMHELERLPADEGAQAGVLENRSLYWLVDGKWTEVVGQETHNGPVKYLKPWIPTER